ncbi:MAG: hypothetical protein E7430_09795 [Ruminococcaceae bacterium]|nr:hypothetical protein [Oscillospiraceae bacterium]
MKRFLSLILALMLVAAPLACENAEAASTFVPEEGKAAVLSTGDKAYALVDKSGTLRLHYFDYDETKFVYKNASVSRELMSGVKMIAGSGNKLMVLKQDGSVWGYKFNYGRDDVFGPVKIMDGIVKLAENGMYNFSVLSKDGVLSDIEPAFALMNGDPVLSDYRITQIDTNVSDVSADGCYIRDNEVRSVRGAQSQTEYVLEFYDGEKVWHYNGSYFVCTESGDLWSWGSNMNGQLGNGGQYDGTGNIKYVGRPSDGVLAYPITNSRPTKILSDVETMWFGDGEIRAIDSDGTVWQWGDGENIMVYVKTVSGTSYGVGEVEYPAGFPDSFGYKPRKVTPSEWTITLDLDKLRYSNDGSIKIRGNTDTGFTYLADWEKSDAAPEATASPTGFTDIRPGYYCEQPVIWAVQKGITTGTTATTFSPDDTCTQAQILTFLWRAAGSPRPDESDVVTFAGVKDQYYYKALLWALQSGLAEKIVPDDDCRRSDVVMYLWKLEGMPDTAVVSNFTDISGSDEYAEAVAWAVEEGITTGTSATTFSPNDTCTRGQIVTFLYRYFTRVDESADIVLS